MDDNSKATYAKPQKTYPQLAEESGVTVKDLKDERVNIKKDIRRLKKVEALRLKGLGYTDDAIARVMEMSVYTVRDLLTKEI